MYKDGTITEVHTLNGYVGTFTIGPDNKFYGIWQSSPRRGSIKLIEIHLNKEMDPRVLGVGSKNSKNNDVKCDKQGNVYVFWKPNIIEVYTPQNETYLITSGIVQGHMAISNSEPQHLYVRGFKTDTRVPAMERIDL
ncbi:hypothetical protein DSO57_1030749 [Entomophthora muscae]|uniref:Uncharacterized protein n=1 Tax=Entomophthora muscae TaxID=34485 RepID=A0ACC2SDH2_9FUNG|nr:hypothetical protein DSO57_1030749 [Entomophthora muscae]